MTADDYNARELVAGRLTPAHVSELTRRVQRQLGLEADGMCGPKTRAALGPGELAPLGISGDGWLWGEGVELVPAHPSWYPLAAAEDRRPPLAIVAHYTATDPGTAGVMAKRRTKPLAKDDRVASWHVSVEADGRLVQMVPFLAGAWHVRQTCPPIEGAGKASLVAVGVELVGHGKVFPPAQVDAARRLWRALVCAYTIPRERAMVTHAELDPSRRRDPGPVWMAEHAPAVLAYAFG